MWGKCGNGRLMRSRFHMCINGWDEHANEDNWFIHVNLWDVHFPARVPLGYGDPYKDSPLPEGIDEDFFNKIKSFVGIQNTTMKSEVAKRYRDGFLSWRYKASN